MANQFIIPQELKTPTKMWKNIYLSDFFFILAYFAIFKVFDIFVDSRLRIVYYIFNVFMAIILTAPSPYNSQKPIFKSLIYLAGKDRHVYQPISPPVVPVIEGNIIHDEMKSILEDKTNHLDRENNS